MSCRRRSGDRERWTETSRTATAITGDIDLSPTKLVAAGKTFPLTVAADVAAFGTSAGPKSARIMRVTERSTRSFCVGTPYAHQRHGGSRCIEAMPAKGSPWRCFPARRSRRARAMPVSAPRITTRAEGDRELTRWRSMSLSWRSARARSKLRLDDRCHILQREWRLAQAATALDLLR